MLDTDGREIVPGLKVWVDSPDCGSVANGQADPGIVVGLDRDDMWRVRLDRGVVIRAAHEMGAPEEPA